MSANAMKESTPQEKETTLSSPATSMNEPNIDLQKEHELIAHDDTVNREENVDESGVEVEYASGFRLAAVVVALALSVFLVSLDMTIVATAIPKITDVRFQTHPGIITSTDNCLGL
jgi:MFS transporter, DHA2 family, glioxin efflux transporter